jgi:hypothetical protein
MSPVRMAPAGAPGEIRIFGPVGRSLGAIGPTVV